MSELQDTARREVERLNLDLDTLVLIATWLVRTKPDATLLDIATIYHRIQTGKADGRRIQ